MRFACLLVVLALGCNGAGRGGRNGSDDGGTPIGGTCSAGQHRCSANQWLRCESDGTSSVETACDSGQVCVDALGCVECDPAKGGCMGDKVVACDARGHRTTTVTQDCAPTTCAGG